LDLKRIVQSNPNVSEVLTEAFAEAASVCFEEEGHRPGAIMRVTLTVSATREEAVEVDWSRPSERALRSWRDRRQCTEFAALAVAFLVIRTFTRYTVIEQADQGDGFDWWLGTDDELFQRKARLEVSGTRGGAPQARQRVVAKRKQTEVSDSSRLSAYVVVVEFKAPATVMERRR
jgi:hypothetical protein